MKYTTHTNDPLIKELVKQYKAALAELAAARVALNATLPESDEWSVAIDALIERGKDVSQIEVTLCAAFVHGLEANTNNAVM